MSFLSRLIVFFLGTNTTQKKAKTEEIITELFSLDEGSVIYYEGCDYKLDYHHRLSTFCSCLTFEMVDYEQIWFSLLLDRENNSITICGGSLCYYSFDEFGHCEGNVEFNLDNLTIGIVNDA